MAAFEEVRRLFRELPEENITELFDRIDFTPTVTLLKTLDRSVSEWMDKGILCLSIADEPIETLPDISDARDDESCFGSLKKDKLLSDFALIEEDTEPYIFFFENAFSKWVRERWPLAYESGHPLYKKDRTLIFLDFIDKEYRDSKLSVLPAKFDGPDYFTGTGMGLPSDEEIRSLVHFVSKESVYVDPESFRLPDEALEVESLKPFFNCYEKILAASLVSDFYSEDRVIVSGIKRLTLSLCSKEDRTVSIKQLKDLEDAVSWVYAERSETRLLLLMDRVSLDLPVDGCVVPSVYAHLSQAIDQARSRYEFVIKDRKEAHAKELSESPQVH